LIALLLLITGSVMAQKKSTPLHLISSESAHGIKKNGVDLLIAYKAVFQQDNSILSSDSAYFYQQQNAFDAFGHVLITQADTLHIYSDKLNYNGNTKIAILTDNVRMVDKDATLTTNHLTYSTATKIGTYTDGGKLVNKDNTLISKNGYYFSSSHDAYFRYNVVLNTIDAIIKTDTLRYNSGSRIAYFYGPTNIYGKKDQDTLYTENGTYNTQTEQAFFGKKNLWKQKTKSLKGDSLFYDRLKGYGRAVKHVTFTDSEQKIILKGDLGEYFKAGERTVVTQHPYVVFVTEDKDSTKTDSLKKDSIKAKTVILKRPALTPPKNTMPVINPALLKGATLTPPKNTMPVVDPAMLKATTLTAPKNTVPLIDSALQKAKLALSQKPIPVTEPDKSKSGKDKKNKKDKKNSKDIEVKTIPVIKKDTVPIKRDSIFMTADTIETQILTYKDLKILREARRLAALRDTSIKVIPSIVYTKPVKSLDIIPLRMRADTTIFHRNYFARPVAKKDTSQHKDAAAAGKSPKKALKNPSLKKGIMGIDSVNLTRNIELSDTARVRILSAAHHAKIFKSDLQAKADSIFFSYSDSIARMYVHPMIWVQGSQLSGDTINLQMRHKQLDNLEMFPSAFIVNIEKNDSLHFNQIGGRKMRGFFKNSKLDRVFVDGNAETIYFDRDSLKVTQMHRTISSKIRVNFKSNEVRDVTWFVKADARVIPISKVKDDDKVLKGFLWKPKDRPVSKESIIPSGDSPPAKKPPGKTSSDKKPPVKGDIKNALKPDVKGEAKSTLKPDTKMSADSLKLKADTLQHLKLKTEPIKIKTDSTKIKPHEQSKQ
jgi:lipopolysaccharide export system protein LptA